MEQWKYQPAHDLGLSERERLRSLQRESGLLAVTTRHCWWALLRTYFALGQHVTVEGRRHIPASLPFMMVANHASHFDALVLAMALPATLRNRIFPIAAGDTFFDTPLVSAFAASLMNALPMWRKNAGRHAMEQLRSRLVDEPCGYILFPEGTRSRTGQMNPFRSGVGMLIAQSPVPVIPCHVSGTFHALPAGKTLPRRSHIHLHVGPSLSFSDTPNTREGWDLIAQSLEQAVTALAQ
jgi:1-acyl-sn-glycerol-3-phosphate acyltransferase